MARALRIEFKNAFYHIMARGNERKPIFREDEDYKKLTEIFRKAKRKYSLIIYFYSHMPNHYHLGIETTEANLTRAMHFIQTTYTIYFNHKYGRVGHLFQGRYKALLVDKNSYLLELSRYIHLNPLRARIIKRIEDYKWSSYRDYIGLRDSDLVETETILKQFGNKKRVSQKKYREFCYQGKGIDWDIFNDKIYGGIILGTKEFSQKIKEKIKKLGLSKEIPLNRKLKTRKSKDRILEIVYSHYNKTRDEVVSLSGEARKIAIYLIRKHTDMDLKTIARLFGNLHYSNISKTVSRFESKLESNRALKNKLYQIENKI